MGRPHNLYNAGVSVYYNKNPSQTKALRVCVINDNPRGFSADYSVRNFHDRYRMPGRLSKIQLRIK